MFSVTTLMFDLEFIVCQECICLAQHNNDSKFPHFPLLGDKHFFKRETSFPIAVVVIYSMTALVVPVLHFAILKLN